MTRAGGELEARAQKIDGIEVVGCRSTWAAGKALATVDLCHAHDGRSVQAVGFAHLRYRRPYVVTRRVMNPLKSRWITPKLYRMAAGVVAISTAVKQQLLLAVPGLDINLIPSAQSGVLPNLERAAQLRASSAGRLRVGHVGALELDSKGQLTLIAAAKANPSVDFVLVGSGRDHDRLLAASASLDNVELTGQVVDVASYLASFDIFAFPSLREGFGSVILDAMAAGLPIVAKKTGGIPDILGDNEHGLIRDAGNDTEFLLALRAMIDDPALRMHYAKASLERVARYSSAIMAAQYQALYEHLVSGERMTTDS